MTRRKELRERRRRRRTIRWKKPAAILERASNVLECKNREMLWIAFSGQVWDVQSPSFPAEESKQQEWEGAMGYWQLEGNRVLFVLNMSIHKNEIPGFPFLRSVIWDIYRSFVSTIKKRSLNYLEVKCGILECNAHTFPFVQLIHSEDGCSLISARCSSTGGVQDTDTTLMLMTCSIESTPTTKRKFANKQSSEPKYQLFNIYI